MRDALLEKVKEPEKRRILGELEVVKEIHNKHIGERRENENGEDGGNEVDTETSKMLGLDLPPPPLFKDRIWNCIHVPLFNILKKFDGETVTDQVVRPDTARMRYHVTKLPRYLIVHMRRFTRNNFFVEKNPTLVNFPVKNLELKDFIPLPAPTDGERLRSKHSSRW
ncbi:hypothetical protein OROGR_023429 [Orobanche gracilis]